MRKGYLLINNASTPLGEREFWKKKDLTTKNKKLSRLFFLVTGGIISLKRKTPLLFLFLPGRGHLTLGLEPLFFWWGKVCG